MCQLFFNSQSSWFCAPIYSFSQILLCFLIDNVAFTWYVLLGTQIASAQNIQYVLGGFSCPACSLCPVCQCVVLCASVPFAVSESLTVCLAEVDLSFCFASPSGVSNSYPRYKKWWWRGNFEIQLTGYFFWVLTCTTDILHVAKKAHTAC